MVGECGPKGNGCRWPPRDAGRATGDECGVVWEGEDCFYGCMVRPIAWHRVEWISVMGSDKLGERGIAQDVIETCLTEAISWTVCGASIAASLG